MYSYNVTELEEISYNITKFEAQLEVMDSSSTPDYDGTTNGTSAIPTFLDLALDTIANKLLLYYIPLLIVLGILGNSLSIYVFFKSKLRLQSTSQYLSALAASDNVFLLFVLLPWLNINHWNGLYHYWGFCQLSIYISYVSNLISSWLVVAFTVERFVAVVYPLKRGVLCSVSRSRFIILCVVLASVLYSIPVLFFAEAGNVDCNINYEYMDPAALFNIFDTIFTFTIPLGIIVFLNSWIMVEMFRVMRARRLLVNEDPETLNRMKARRRRPYPLYPTSQQRVTRMLLFVSSVFSLLNLPAYSTRIYVYLYPNEMSNPTFSAMRMPALQSIALMIYNTNFGINFLLYCVSGENFRKALMQTVPWCGCRKEPYRRPVTWTVSGNPDRQTSISTSNASGLDVGRSFGVTPLVNSSTVGVTSVTQWRNLQRCNRGNSIAGVTLQFAKQRIQFRNYSRPDIINVCHL